MTAPLGSLGCTSGLPDIEVQAYICKNASAVHHWVGGGRKISSIPPSSLGGEENQKIKPVSVSREKTYGSKSVVHSFIQCILMGAYTVLSSLLGMRIQQ